MPIACKYCIMTNGLNGSEIKDLPKTDAEFVDHLESEHHQIVIREGETREQASERFYAKYPEALDQKTCKCMDCRRDRGE